MAARPRLDRDRAARPDVLALFFIVYAALAHTTVARGTLALSTLPLLTMVVAALLGAEKLTARKTFGVLLAMGGVALRCSRTSQAPEGAWRGTSS